MTRADVTFVDSEFAPAKVNLFLHVLGRRDDGFHRLDSLVAFAAAGDHLSYAPGGALRLDVTGPFAASLGGEGDNLVLRAARRFAAAHGVDPSGTLVLDKRLPVASGIGGGSADAAACLRLLARRWSRPVPAGLALGLGADVPVCLRGRPARMGGVGEVLSEPPALPALALALVNPRVAVSTASVFARCTPAELAAVMPPAWRDLDEFVGWLGTTRNDLEAPARTLCPVIGEVLAALAAQPGCRLARMSGSGATCFGIFGDAGLARDAAASLGRHGWWSEAG